MSVSDATLTIEALVAAAASIRALRPPPPSPAAIESAARFVGRVLGVDCGAWVAPDGRIMVTPLNSVATGDVIRAESELRRVLGDDALSWIKIAPLHGTVLPP